MVLLQKFNITACLLPWDSTVHSLKPYHLQPTLSPWQGMASVACSCRHRTPSTGSFGSRASHQPDQTFLELCCNLRLFVPKLSSFPLSLRRCETCIVVLRLSSSSWPFTDISTNKSLTHLMPSWYLLLGGLRQIQVTWIWQLKAQLRFDQKCGEEHIYWI